MGARIAYADELDAVLAENAAAREEFQRRTDRALGEQLSGESAAGTLAESVAGEVRCALVAVSITRGSAVMSCWGAALEGAGRGLPDRRSDLQRSRGGLSRRFLEKPGGLECGDDRKGYSFSAHQTKEARSPDR